MPFNQFLNSKWSCAAVNSNFKFDLIAFLHYEISGWVHSFHCITYLLIHTYHWFGLLVNSVFNIFKDERKIHLMKAWYDLDT
jgi:hypothetical protein